MNPDPHSKSASRHPDHDRLCEEVRSWYRTSWPDRGYHVENRRFGFYRRHAGHPDAGLIIIDTLTVGEVSELLADASTYFDNRPVHVGFEDKDLDRTLGPALVAAGCAIDKANTYLAHVGPRPDRVQLPGVTVEAVTPDTLMDYVQVKLKGFANSEDDPPAKHIDEELSVRKPEFESIGRFLIARIGIEPAAILGYYEGSDRLIFNLATRAPYRMRGIARKLLCQVVADSYDKGCRSIIINTDPTDTPIQWYNRLGFTDEVYYRRAYAFDPKAGL
jgi:ribosomal protein S18 acetylase RimI-like enzyme